MLRRSITFAVITLPLILYGTACQSSEPSPSTPSVLQPQIATFQALESTLKPRGSTPPKLGVYVLNTNNGVEWKYRSDERFRMMSTFKALACANILAKVDAGELKLQNNVTLKEEDFEANWSPITQGKIGQSMTLQTLCSAVMSQSDNTAANALLRVLGGPESLTHQLRTWNDNITRLDRREPELNLLEGIKDTTTPKAITTTLKHLLKDDLLTPKSRRQLSEWLMSNQYSQHQLKAGLPSNWKVADRTGAASDGALGIIAEITPPNHKPIYAAIYVSATASSRTEVKAIFAQIGEMISGQIISP